MTGNRVSYFPKQAIDYEDKQKPEWYEACIDYVIQAGLSSNNRDETYELLNILQGEISESAYAKTLNPYNTNKEKFTRFPATMRNIDIIKDVVRRYVSEYIKGDHEFIVSVNNPELILERDIALKEAIMQECTVAFMQEVNNKIQELQQQVESGEIEEAALQQVDVESLVNPEEFKAKFIKDYIDKTTIQASEVKNLVDDVVDNENKILTAFFNWVVTGECYTYHSVYNNKIIKEVVPTTEMYPVPNGKQNVDEFDMVARQCKMSINDIESLFEGELDEQQLNFFKMYYHNYNGNPTRVSYEELIGHFPNRGSKFNNNNDRLFDKTSVDLHINNGDLIDVWHAVWRGKAKVGILQFINEAGIIDETVVDEDFVFDSNSGHISIEWEYREQIMEGYRIGNESTGIYPIKARPIVYQFDPPRLPYTGKMEILPQFGKFSIVKTLVPFQILINIFSYHREMMIAKNKLFIMVVAKSLLGEDPDDTFYRMAADGILPYADDEDTNSLKAQQIRMLNANVGTYINDITNLINSIKNDAREMVDMTPQRYGAIANSAGKGVTEEAIIRGSMGSVIITYAFNKFRERDYSADMDSSKLAWVDGLDTFYFDNNKNKKHISLDVEQHVYSNYVIKAKNSERESDKLKQLKDWAFSAAQNGDMEMALAAILGDNIASVEKAVSQFSELKRQHELELKAMDDELAKFNLEAELEKIKAKGVEDRALAELKANYALMTKGIDIDLQLNKDTASSNTSDTQKSQLDISKLNLEREKARLDFINKERDREVKLKDIDSKETIAKTNRNRYSK